MCKNSATWFCRLKNWFGIEGQWVGVVVVGRWNYMFFARRVSPKLSDRSEILVDHEIAKKKIDFIFYQCERKCVLCKYMNISFCVRSNQTLNKIEPRLLGIDHPQSSSWLRHASYQKCAIWSVLASRAKRPLWESDGTASLSPKHNNHMIGLITIIMMSWQ